MKREPRKLKRSSDLSGSVHQQLNMYALAATAAGVGMLALPRPAEARIVFTPAHRVIGPKSHYRLDLNHDGITDFTLRNVVSCGTDMCFYDFFQKPAPGNRAIGYIFDNQLLLDSALQRGARIGPHRHFLKGSGGLVDVVYSDGGQSTNVFGPWPNTKSRYLGLKFQIKGKTHYGWARFNVNVQKTAITATLTGYAYETIPNKAIIAGVTEGSDESSMGQPSPAAFTAPVPETATLSVLAMGAPGLSIWRREDVVGTMQQNFT